MTLPTDISGDTATPTRPTTQRAGRTGNGVGSTGGSAKKSLRLLIIAATYIEGQSYAHDLRKRPDAIFSVSAGDLPLKTGLDFRGWVAVVTPMAAVMLSKADKTALSQLRF